jgi:putative endonuclease
MYVLECSDKTLYSDVTEDLSLSLSLHRTTGFGYTRPKTRRPVRLILAWTFKSKALAIKARDCFRGKNKADKIMYISSILLERICS